MRIEDPFSRLPGEERLIVGSKIKAAEKRKMWKNHEREEMQIIESDMRHKSHKISNQFDPNQPKKKTSSRQTQKNNSAKRVFPNATNL